MHYKKPTQGTSKGLSLVEVLIVIAVIGLISSIAIPVLSDITGTADNSVSKRNAQLLSDTFAFADQAGVSFPVATELGVCNSLIAGVDGNFMPGRFQVSLTTEERDAAMNHLTFEDDFLLYSPD
ncbi:MAG: prepilin-type N-terminal cleavage/methylation domain-containing protein [Verrucomicrobiota bacterium]